MPIDRPMGFPLMGIGLRPLLILQVSHPMGCPSYDQQRATKQLRPRSDEVTQ